MTQQYTITAVTRHKDPVSASQELRRQFDHSIDAVIFFCSTCYRLAELGVALDKAFAGIPLFGCTSAGEITNQGYESQCIIAVGFKSSHFKISAQMINPITEFNLVQAHTTVNELIEQSQHPSFDKRFMMTLLDGLSADEEQFLNSLDSAAGEIEHFGGSAGDDINLAKTHIYHRGKFYQDSAIVIMVNTRCNFEVFSTNHIGVAQEKLVVTAADSPTRTIYELNAEPAAIEYARLLNLSVDQLTPEVFSLNPLAVKVGGNYYFRSIQKVNEQDNSLTFYCAVDSGIVLTAVTLEDVFARLGKKLMHITARHGEHDIVLACDCILRRLEIQQKNLEITAQSLFEQYNIVGFNTYGEHINGIHLNQTFTGVYISGEDNE
ncbi:nitric oxide-sensing protein NosP [Psychrobium sp. 1_MG-2023]|uniref:nitric oxide-sensing protein NosP n=1 Tax=Psychrobium sp. 1_MG-2023 TaxID=3062624 RepID=UPI000C340F97|nr:nitric oxide-sensing protein NosP [Psychrobium sp. 1_MG-2023]MDP2561575.1 nitric oxide-sensing protein NosP [Psychrobium sp. 1_MG-2023]PKF55036.1 GfdT protein [Alteromonadales bacterium alter-6D02]